MLDTEHRLALLEFHATPTFFIVNRNHATTVEVHHRTVGQGHLAMLAQPGTELGTVRLWLAQPAE